MLGPTPAHLLEERGLDGEILGHDVEAEKVPVDPGAGHGQAVEQLVFLRGQFEQLTSLLHLQTGRWV